MNSPKHAQTGHCSWVFTAFGSHWTYFSLSPVVRFLNWGSPTTYVNLSYACACSRPDYRVYSVVIVGQVGWRPVVLLNLSPW